VKSILAPKFGSLVQKWDKTSLGKGGVGWNPGPPFPHLFLPLPRPRGGREEGGRKAGGRGGIEEEGVNGGRGGP
jgi:hypothetical protein